MKINKIKYNKKGLLRAENTNPKFKKPEKNLSNKKINLSLNNNYFKIK